MAEKHDTVRGLVLAGGGAKGSYQVGVYQALMELGWLPDVITGASVGSLNAALFVMGKVNEAADLWRSLDNHGVLELPEGKTPEELRDILAHHVQAAEIPRMVVTMGAQGAVYAMQDGSCGICPARKVDVKDTTGAGDAFFAGITMGLTYGKTMDEACEIGTRLSASVICTSENVCPRFLPSEFGLEPGRAAGEQLTFDI